MDEAMETTETASTWCCRHSGMSKWSETTPRDLGIMMAGSISITHSVSLMHPCSFELGLMQSEALKTSFPPPPKDEPTPTPMEEDLPSDAKEQAAKKAEAIKEKEKGNEVRTGHVQRVWCCLCVSSVSHAFTGYLGTCLVGFLSRLEAG